MESAIFSFQQELEKLLGDKLQLRINDNRSTMLSVKWDPQGTSVSMHRMFLNAPKNIMEDLACYIGSKKNKMAPGIKAFIEDNLQKLDYSYKLDLNSLQSCGQMFDLQRIYDRVNADYFDKKLDLSITWFGQRVSRSRSRITLGLYIDSMKLIKIHRLLDQRIPEYVVSYVVFHEMLHSIYRPYVGKNGRRNVHPEEFKAHEKKFREYPQAQEWLNKQRDNFFKGVF